MDAVGGTLSGAGVRPVTEAGLSRFVASGVEGANGVAVGRAWDETQILDRRNRRALQERAVPVDLVARHTDVVGAEVPGEVDLGRGDDLRARLAGTPGGVVSGCVLTLTGAERAELLPAASYALTV